MAACAVKAQYDVLHGDPHGSIYLLPKSLRGKGTRVPSIALLELRNPTNSLLRDLAGHGIRRRDAASRGVFRCGEPIGGVHVAGAERVRALPGGLLGHRLFRSPTLP